MSRTQWWSLTALLAVVLGLLCGPTAFASTGSGASSVPVAHVVQEHGQAHHATVAEATGERAPVPGCGKLRDHDGEPAVPSRARSAHDHAPGLAPWGLPAATGALPAEPPPGIRACAPVPYTPTPVELSVLRV
ncbi:hypothetical protein K7395_18605 [Streptomyces filamentosus]|uniref:Secreted protein n=2 Tax=Streptomyces filamentosus TaxID=67294 RepID=A0ABY4UWG6_STRFL|nr:hypothetical protein [Streptomyces filamentosus]EFE75813.1 predicted protein [Streptomyces filamentosus NRRL 15998]EWS92828.1 hypothetical protein SSIG_03372 [Streptomyces filamentosus NRRL 11379]MYR79857.1 hypothetical protein [Streptomyces sp. SID5466]USC48596.1 hypothetical protein K7395_18605 [Streptomyces filamentosus]